MCPNSTCDHTRKGLLLGKAEQHKVVYFGCSGMVPAYSVQLYCKSYKTTYHANYKVTDIVQIADHYFVDYGVVRLWKAMMHTSCTSATNCPYIYNIALVNAESTQFPGTKWFSKDITMDHVWNTFIICTLLEDCHKCHCDVRQELMHHFCAKCTHIYNHANKLVSVIVVNGIVVSCPCCSVPNCWVHLCTSQDHFCYVHSACLEQCAIKGYARSVISGSLTCNIPAHQESEALHTLQSKRLANKKRLCVQFTCNYTHCEELIVAPCGMIHAHETMHNAEGVGKMCPTHNDPFFQDISLSIDIFHFECKHSKQDTFCQENCNPAAFLELKMDDEEWYFNSSACKQTNSWFSKFNPINFNFFLNEMILCRNQETLKKLERTGKKPSVWARMSLPGV
ncbi:hypothetical protein BDR06DRAFT_983640 [Suillus hirtellus]|nr:hypothetical protein BDR06DRAFT_983640 [Suillus hirtellus]